METTEQRQEMPGLKRQGSIGRSHWVTGSHASTTNPYAEDHASHVSDVCNRTRYRALYE